MDAVSDSTSAVFAATVTLCGAAYFSTVLVSTYVGADPRATSVGHAYGAAASFAAVLGLPAARMANRSVVPWNATAAGAGTWMERAYGATVLPSTVLGRAQCAAATTGASTGMEGTYGAAVLPSTVLGGAQCMGPPAAACALVRAAQHGAALGQHGAVTTSRAAATATAAFAGPAASCSASDTTNSNAAVPSTTALSRAASTSCSPYDNTTSHAAAPAPVAFARAAPTSRASKDAITFPSLAGAGSR